MLDLFLLSRSILEVHKRQTKTLKKTSNNSRKTKNNKHQAKPPEVLSAIAGPIELNRPIPLTRGAPYGGWPLVSCNAFSEQMMTSKSPIVEKWVPRTLDQGPMTKDHGQNCAVLYSSVQHCTVLYKTVQYCTVLYSTVQYSAVQSCTVQYCTVLYSTVQ